jgi:hypothetical protein
MAAEMTGTAPQPEEQSNTNKGELPMSKIIATVTVALVTTIAASSAFAGGCHDSYSYDTYTKPYVTYDTYGY